MHILEQYQLDALAPIAKKHPEVKQLLEIYKNYTESPEIDFYRSTSLIIRKLAADMAHLAELDENLLDGDKSDASFDRVAKLLKDSGKMITDLQEAREKIFKTKPEESEAKEGEDKGLVL